MRYLGPDYVDTYINFGTNKASFSWRVEVDKLGVLDNIATPQWNNYTLLSRFVTKYTCNVQHILDKQAAFLTFIFGYNSTSKLVHLKPNNQSIKFTNRFNKLNLVYTNLHYAWHGICIILWENSELLDVYLLPADAAMMVSLTMAVFSSTYGSTFPIIFTSTPATSLCTRRDLRRWMDPVPTDSKPGCDVNKWMHVFKVGYLRNHTFRNNFRI